MSNFARVPSDKIGVATDRRVVAPYAGNFELVAQAAL
jgi:hypothetical protein